LAPVPNWLFVDWLNRSGNTSKRLAQETRVSIWLIEVEARR
jgi:hypothetical protein